MISDNGIRFTGDEFMELWDNSIKIQHELSELKTENRILEDWVKRLEYRIQQLEENQ